MLCFMLIHDIEDDAEQFSGHLRRAYPANAGTNPGKLRQ
jgi:hypothetical protein